MILWNWCVIIWLAEEPIYGEPPVARSAIPLLKQVPMNQGQAMNTMAVEIQRLTTSTPPVGPRGQLLNPGWKPQNATLGILKAVTHSSLTVLSCSPFSRTRSPPTRWKWCSWLIMWWAEEPIYGEPPSGTETPACGSYLSVPGKLQLWRTRARQSDWHLSGLRRVPPWSGTLH